MSRQIVDNPSGVGVALPYFQQWATSAEKDPTAMTITINVPYELMTLADWDLLPEEVCRRAELVEGVLEVNPSPTIMHQIVSQRLVDQLALDRSPLDLIAIQGVDVLIDAKFPPTLRCPDISVASRSLIDSRAKRLYAADVFLAVEIVSPGSGRRDRVMKLSEYAEALIPHYWIVTTERPAIGLDMFRLDGGVYVRSGHAEGGTVTITEPFAVTLDLDALRAW